MGYELRFHPALPGWCKVLGLEIKAVPACEGGGFMLPTAAGQALVEGQALHRGLRARIADLEAERDRLLSYIDQAGAAARPTEMAGPRGSDMRDVDASQGRATPRPGQTQD